MKRLLLLALLFAAPAFAADRVIINPDVDGDTKIKANDNSVITDVITVKGASSSVGVGPGGAAGFPEQLLDIGVASGDVGWQLTRGNGTDATIDWRGYISNGTFRLASRGTNAAFVDQFVLLTNGDNVGATSAATIGAAGGTEQAKIEGRLKIDTNAASTTGLVISINNQGGTSGTMLDVFSEGTSSATKVADFKDSNGTSRFSVRSDGVIGYGASGNVWSGSIQMTVDGSAGNCTPICSSTYTVPGTGSGIANISRTGTGAYDVNFTGSFFNSNPICVMSDARGGSVVCTSGGQPTTTKATATCFASTTGAATDTNRLAVMCMGPRS